MMGDFLQSPCIMHTDVITKDATILMNVRFTRVLLDFPTASIIPAECMIWT